MTIYNSNDLFYADVQWLLQHCTLPLIQQHKLAKYEQHRLLETVKSYQTFDASTIESYFQTLFQALHLENPLWFQEPQMTLLPNLALLPDIGMCLVLGKTTQGWQCYSRHGQQVYTTFPDQTLFTSLHERREIHQDKTASEMFKKVAFEQKRTIFNAAIATLSISFLALATSFYSMQVYDRVIPTQGISTLIALSVGVFIAMFLEMLLKIARSMIIDYASIQMDRHCAFNIFDRFLRIRLNAFPNSIGNLSGQLQSYATIRSFITTFALFITADFPFAFFFIFIIALIGGSIMGIIPLIFLSISLVTAFIFKHKIEILTKQSIAASNKKLGLLVESVEKAETLKSSGHGFVVSSRWNTLNDEAMKDDTAIKHTGEFASFITAFLQQLSYVILIAVGAYLATTTDQLTMGGLIAISILSGRALSPLINLPNLFVQWARAKMSLDDLNRIYTLPLDNEGMQKPLVPQTIQPRFECQNITFAYTQETPPLHINQLHIKSGEKIAVLGAIGSGKSTLLKLLAGLYSPQTGNILLDGLNLAHIAQDELSRWIGYLPQTTQLVSGTLRDNITLGLVGIDDTTILETAQKTGLIFLINALPRGLDTLIPEGGNTVSGGQKQLIALTRLLLAHPKIWLLDEPTANIDEATEQRILHILSQDLTSQETLIIVTHKPLLLRLVDRIIILTHQGIVMDGLKDAVLAELMKKQSTPVSATQGKDS